ncbi:ParB N-terminal domain-containing protein [Roseateles sp.]|uniref:ParB N-terminal domain-containing protein n=1 Tax=Roseateles sp. TaxID=1971397 RepID=UPI003BA73A87
MRISDICIGQRVRKDMGDLDALAASIREHGLLHPPAVTADGTLIAGHRRIQACARLGMESIPVRAIDVGNLLSAERDENQVRKDFTPSEAVAVARAIEAQLKAASKARRSAGAKARWAREKGLPVNLDESSKFTQASASAAEVVGMCRQRYEQAKEVVEAAEQAAEKFGDIVETMDATGNVRAAHTELRRRRDNQPVRHAVLRHMRHRDPNQEIERAITSLSGLALGIERIDVDGLDSNRVDGWAAELKRQVATINRFIRSLQT